MKARWKYEKNEYGHYSFDVCHDYPNCKCEGHYVWEKRKTATNGGGKDE